MSPAAAQKLADYLAAGLVMTEIFMDKAREDGDRDKYHYYLGQHNATQLLQARLDIMRSDAARPDVTIFTERS